MTTISWQIDELGRVALPYEVREVLGWSAKTQLELTVQEDESVVVRACKPTCRLCGSGEGKLIPVAKGRICTACLQTAFTNSAKGALGNRGGKDGAEGLPNNG